MRGLYTSYLFRDKDPVIDVMRGVVEDANMSYQDVRDESGVSKSTIRNWFHGKTRRPQFATVAAVAGACGAGVNIGRYQVKPNGKPKRK